MRVAELTFRAMGGIAQVLVVDGGDHLVELASRRIAELERLWTRFDALSEIGRLNASAGSAVHLSSETIDVVDLAVVAWRATDGLFDPTVYDAVLSAGYDQSFSSIATKQNGNGSSRPQRPPGCAEIEIDRRSRTIRLPAGVHIDLGGIGKGAAADIVVELLRNEGAAGALVNLGGDLRVSGVAPHEDGWCVGVEEPDDRTAVERLLMITDGGVATSSKLGRTWERDGRRMHHVIDPRTGDPEDGAAYAATVVAADAAWAEVLATAVLIAQPAQGEALLRRHGARGVLYGIDRTSSDVLEAVAG